MKERLNLKKRLPKTAPSVIAWVMAETGTVLVVEDDQDLRELIRIAGRKRSYRMLAAGNGLEAEGMIESGEIHGLVILDITMPCMDGFGFCRWLREDHPLIPVIFLSARAGEYDKIVALEIGKDDYLTMPFSMRELFARVDVGLRRVRLFAAWSACHPHGFGAPNPPQAPLKSRYRNRS